jgi:hypothetical protein
LLLCVSDCLDSEDGGSMDLRNVGKRSHPHGDAIKSTVLRGVTPFNVSEVYHISQEHTASIIRVEI